MAQLPRNFLGGMLAADQIAQQRQASELQQVMGLASVLRQQQAAQQEAQLAPFRLQELQARAEERQQGQAFQTALPGLVGAATKEDGSIDYGRLSGSLMSTPGGLTAGMNLRRTEEDRLARVDQQTQNRQAQMERLSMQLGLEDQWKAASEETKRYLGQLSADTRMTVAQMAAALKSGLGGGGGRMEPFKYSVGGKNVQGWRDKFGNVFDSEHKPVSKIDPEITSADQAAEQKRTSEQATLASVQDKLDRIQRINASNPALTSGAWGGAANAAAFLWNQTLGNVTDTSVSTPNEQARQLRDFVLGDLGSLSRLSNQERQRIEDAWKLGLSGNPKAVESAIGLTRQLVNAKYAGGQSPVARSQPGKSSVPPPPPGFKVDQ
jgi:hypothetical protein